MFLLRPDLHIAWRDKGPPRAPERLAAIFAGHGLGFARERGLLRRTVMRMNGAVRVDTPGLHKNRPLSVQHDSFFQYPGSKTVTV